MTIQASITIQVAEGLTVTLRIVPGKLGQIWLRHILGGEDLPPDWYEITGLLRSGRPGTFGEAITTLRVCLPLLFSLSLGLPILWICSERHARFAERAMGKQYRCTILRGSLRNANPYPPLSAPWGMGETTDDEHVVMLVEEQG